MEKGIDALILHINKLQGKILKEELDLEQKDKSLPARIPGLEENTVMLIAKLKEQTLDQKDVVDTSTQSLTDRIRHLEKRIKSLKSYIKQTKFHLVNVETYVCERVVRSLDGIDVYDDDIVHHQ
eukprot:9161411-Ditylum_brightwellii.AAC.1